MPLLPLPEVTATAKMLMIRLIAPRRRRQKKAADADFERRLE